MTTSFGIHSAVTLHLVTRQLPGIPVVFIDTGYAPGETYEYAQKLTEELNLNLKVFKSPIDPTNFERQFGRIWESKDVESMNKYHKIRKVEPLQRALKELGAQAWIAGLRRQQTHHRASLQKVVKQGHQYKIHPILNWSTEKVEDYAKEHKLPVHPLASQGYVTVGDWHSSRPLSTSDQHDRNTRFNGLKQECGIHLEQLCPA